MNLSHEINIANIIPCTEAEGPGKRIAIWVQGCPLRCAECCNPEMLSFDGGTPTSIDELMTLALEGRSSGVEGMTLIGGEPFAHAEALAELSRRSQLAGLSVMVFTGYTLSELLKLPCPSVGRFLDHIDLLVDGPYDRARPDASRRWIGSTNQQIHFLTNRYSKNDACWQQPDTLEIRWDGTEVLVNGFPAQSAVGLWKRNPRGESAS